MDHYAADVSAVVEHLDLHNAVHVGHSHWRRPGCAYVARYGQPQAAVAKAVLISAVPPLMVKTEQNPGGTPIEVFDGFRSAGGEPRPVLSRRRLWPRSMASIVTGQKCRRDDPELVATGNDRQRQGPL